MLADGHRDKACHPSQTSAASCVCVSGGWGNIARPCDQVCGLSHFQMCNAEQVLAQARKRKRRTSIETNVKGTLESFFRKCVKPSPQEISQIAEDLNLDKDVGLEGGGQGFQTLAVPEHPHQASFDTGRRCGRVAGAGCHHLTLHAEPQEEPCSGSGASGPWRCHQQKGLVATLSLGLQSTTHPCLISPPSQVVRVWFCNRRQKGKRLLLPFGNETEGVMYDMNQSLVPPGLPIPVTSQGYSLAPSPPVYMPPFHKAEMFPQALQPGLSMNNSSH